MTQPPQTATISPDGRWWWDGAQWQPIAVPPPAVAVMNVRTRQVLLGGAAATALGSLLPWATGPFGISFSGTSGDGVITLIVAVVVAGLSLAFRRRLVIALAVLAGLVAMATAVYDTAHISTTEFAGVGYGLVVTDVGALAMVVGTVLAYRDRRTARTMAP